MTGWTLRPGDKVIRKRLHGDFGGRRQGGIGPSAQSPNVFVFSDSKVGAKHGYRDDWADDGCFHYTGEGRRGDQEMKQGNAAILNHRAQGRALRVFEGVGGTVEYRGEFELAPGLPWYERDAPETGGGPERQVIVFRLQPVDTVPPARSRAGPSKRDQTERAPVEESSTERFLVDPSREPYVAERRESELVTAYREHLESIGHTVCRHRFLPIGEVRPIITDLYDETENVLVEAKGSVTRWSIRMALGQLADYRRFLPAPICAILVPTRPRSDLMRLAEVEGVTLIWRTTDGFDST